jgi:hypothetical protein
LAGEVSNAACAIHKGKQTSLLALDCNKMCGLHGGAGEVCGRCVDPTQQPLHGTAVTRQRMPGVPVCGWPPRGIFWRGGGRKLKGARGGLVAPPLPVAPTLVWGRRPGMAPQHLDGAIRCYFPTGSTSLTMLAHEARPFAKRGAPPHLGWLKVDLPPIAPPSRVVTNGMFEMPMLDIDSECPLGRALHHGPLAPPRMGTAISMANAVSWWSWGLHR